MTLRLATVEQLPAIHREHARAQLQPQRMPIAVAAPDPQPAKKPLKYLNEPIEIDGHKLDSGKEGERYTTLRGMELGGLITDLRVHPRYPLHAAGGQLVGEYEADFEYRQDGRLVVEDVKSGRTVETRLYQFKRRFMAAEYGIEIREFVHRWKRKAKRAGGASAPIEHTKGG